MTLLFQGKVLRLFMLMCLRRVVKKEKGWQFYGYSLPQLHCCGKGDDSLLFTAISSNLCPKKSVEDALLKSQVCLCHTCSLKLQRFPSLCMSIEEIGDFMATIWIIVCYFSYIWNAVSMCHLCTFTEVLFPVCHDNLAAALLPLLLRAVTLNWRICSLRSSTWLAWLRWWWQSLW